MTADDIRVGSPRMGKAPRHAGKTVGLQLSSLVLVHVVILFASLARLLSGTGHGGWM